MRGENISLSPIEMKEVILEAVVQKFRSSISENEFHSMFINGYNIMDGIAGQIVIQVQRNLMSEKRQDIVDVKFTTSYPDGWWEAFKQEYFSNWLLEKFPVKMKSVEQIKQVYVNRVFGFPNAYQANNPYLSKFIIYDNHKVL